MKLYALLFVLLSTVGLRAHDREYDVNLIVFSKDSPLQLHAFLESLAAHAKGFHTVSVLYSAHNERLARAYEKVHQDFIVVDFVCADPKAGIVEADSTGSTQFTKTGMFKAKLCSLLEASRARYIMFATDDMVVVDSFNMRECAMLLEKTKASSFSLWTGKQELAKYAQDVKVTEPLVQQISDSVCVWRCNCGIKNMRYPFDMTVFPKAAVARVCSELSYDSPVALKFAWSKQVCVPTHGLCFEKAKLMNLPATFVPIDHLKKGVRRLTSQQLLELFEDGGRIDVTGLYKL